MAGYFLDRPCMQWFRFSVTWVTFVFQGICLFHIVVRSTVFLITYFPFNNYGIWSEVYLSFLIMVIWYSLFCLISLARGLLTSLFFARNQFFPPWIFFLQYCFSVLYFIDFLFHWFLIVFIIYFWLLFVFLFF